MQGEAPSRRATVRRPAPHCEDASQHYEIASQRDRYLIATLRKRVKRRGHADRLELYGRTTSASTAPRTLRSTCCPHAYVLVTVPRVSRSCEHFPDGFNLHLLQPRTSTSCAQSGGHVPTVVREAIALQEHVATPLTPNPSSIPPTPLTP